MRCSNPSCRRATAKADPGNVENWIDLGVAGHITAASAEGPRYDASISTEERRSAKNGIWLCHHCAKEVDSATSTYTVATLITWKMQAESCTARDAAATLDEIGRLVGDIEATRTAIRDLVQDRRQTDPTSRSAFGTDWHEATSELLQHSRASRDAYETRISHMVTDCIVRATGVLGGEHPAVSEANACASYASTNLLGMSEMAEQLDLLRFNLLLR